MTEIIKWTSVEDGLPESQQEVLVTAGNGIIYIARYRSYDYWNEVTGGRPVYVVAWAPMLKGYRRASMPVRPPGCTPGCTVDQMFDKIDAMAAKERKA